MKVVTAVIPLELKEYIDKIIKTDYTSRSEFGRESVKELLIEEMKNYSEIEKEIPVKHEPLDKSIIKINVNTKDEEGNPITHEHQFKVLRILDGNDNKKKKKDENVKR